MKARTTSLYQLSEVHRCHACMLSCFSHVRLFATLCTRARQAPLSMRFSRQGYWSGLRCPPPGDLPDSGIEPMSPALAGGSFTTGTTWEALTLVPVLTKRTKSQLQGQFKKRRRRRILCSEKANSKQDNTQQGGMCYLYQKGYREKDQLLRQIR